MKKILMALLMAGTVLALTACAEIPDGVDQQFHDRALIAFEEIDDDTMELENSDADDVANFQLMVASANSERELDFAKGLEGMVKLQERVINHDGDALAEYLKARQQAMNAMNLGDGDEGDRFQVPTFSFTEEQ